MCGIAGTIELGASSGEAVPLVGRMLDAIAHRGPDAAGLWEGRGVCLGHRRLSVIDLHERANQPMVTPTGSVLTFNGEVYNFQRLRTRLEGGGVRFHTTSDTEVVAATLDRDGVAALPELEGMFAIAHWNPTTRRALLAVDRFGKKPLYYTWDPAANRLAYASELKALLALEGLSREIDEDALQAYLSVGYIPAPMTFLRDVRKMQAGSWLTLDADGLRHGNFFEPSFAPSDLSTGVALREVEAALKGAVQDRLVADVPIGVFLSGGVDSSTLAWALSQVDRKVNAYTIGFEDPAYDESPDARRVAETLGLTHHVRVFEDRDLVRLVPEIPRIFDEPFADSSALPTLLVSRIARKDVTVMVSGDGGDEMFGGYNRHLAVQVASGTLAPVLHAAGKVLPRSHETHPSGAGGLRGGVATMAGAASAWEVYERSVTRHYFAESWADSAVRRQQQAWWNAAPAGLSRAQVVDLRGYMAGDILVKVDRASMATALEVRSPFLDSRVYAVARRLPDRLKVRRTQKKWILRKLLKERGLPGPAGKPKRGFAVPLDAWFRSRLGDHFEQTVLARDARVHSLRRVQACDPGRLLEAHRHGSAHGHRLWALLMLELSLRRLEGTPAPPI